MRKLREAHISLEDESSGDVVQIYSAMYSRNDERERANATNGKHCKQTGEICLTS